MSDSLQDLYAKRDKLLAERKELQRKLADPTAEARVVFDLIFRRKFRLGGDWLDRTKATGRKTALVGNLLGGVRHLYGYLHQEEHIKAAMDRRGPNSVIQGPASNLGFIG